jgi:uncharacterized membrane protein
MAASYVLLLAFGIGIITGLRSLTAPAVVAWAVRFGWLNVSSYHALSFLGSSAAVIVLTILAAVELVVDQLPSTPARTKPTGLIARIVLGGLSGAVVAIAGGQSLMAGCALGAAGGVIGAFAGYQARTGLVRALKVPDIVIALVEDAVAIGGALLIETRF